MSRINPEDDEILRAVMGDLDEELTYEHSQINPDTTNSAKNRGSNIEPDEDYITKMALGDLDNNLGNASVLPPQSLYEPQNSIYPTQQNSVSSISQKPKKKKLKAVSLIVAVILLVLIATGTVTVLLLQKNNITEGTNSFVSSNEEEYVDYPDIDKYFEENSEVISIVPVEKSKNITTEEQTFNDLTARGFSDASITANYTMNGKYYEETEISKGSNAQHPMYNTFYVTQSKDIWGISSINGQVTASPISYLVESESSLQILISESKEIISYDSKGNRFFITNPHNDFIKIKIVDEVNAQTLEEITSEELDKL